MPVIEAVHFDQQLVQGLFALVVDRAHPRSAPPTDRIQFVHKDDGGGIGFGLFEQVTHAAGANADEHLDKLRGAHAVKRRIGFACHGTRQQGLACSGRSREQYPARNACAQLVILLRVPQKFDYFAQFLFGFFHSSYIFECDLRTFLRITAGFAAAEVQDAALGLERLTTHPAPEEEEQNKRQGAEQ